MSKHITFLKVYITNVKKVAFHFADARVERTVQP